MDESICTLDEKLSVVTIIKKVESCNNPADLVLNYEASSFTISYVGSLSRMFLHHVARCKDTFVLENGKNSNVRGNVNKIF